jgi:hypothetical protein
VPRSGGLDPVKITLQPAFAFGNPVFVPKALLMRVRNRRHLMLFLAKLSRCG